MALEMMLWEEYAMAVSLYADPRSYHESYAVIANEFSELQAETFRHKTRRDRGNFIREALHVAVTALRAADQALEDKFH